MKWDSGTTTNINVVIPMAGRGERFSKVGYTTPKPLIPINGKPVIESAVESLGIAGNYIFIVQKEQMDHYGLGVILKRIAPNCKIVEIDTVTEGPACSALLAKNYINNSSELIIANCDQIMEWAPEKFLYNAKLYDGCIVTYHESTPKNSYVRIDSKGKVIEVREKQVISNISLNGIHYWKQGTDFVQSAEEMIANNDRSANKEFYISSTYNYMINRGKSVGFFHIPNQQHINIGVPEDLENYLRILNDNGQTQ